MSFVLHAMLQDWPPTFDSYLKVKYFWAVFVCANLIWISVPLYIYWYTLKELRRLLAKEKTN